MARERHTPAGSHTSWRQRFHTRARQRLAARAARQADWWRGLAMAAPANSRVQQFAMERAKHWLDISIGAQTTAPAAGPGIRGYRTADGRLYHIDDIDIIRDAHDPAHDPTADHPHTRDDLIYSVIHYLADGRHIHRADYDPPRTL